MAPERSPMQIPDRSRQPLASSSRHELSVNNDSSDRHPQYKSSNESAAQHGQATAAFCKLATLDLLLESENRYEQALLEAGQLVDDAGWTFVPRSEAEASDNSDTTGGTGGNSHRAISGLTAFNIDLLNTANCDTFTERLCQNAAGCSIKHASLKMHKHSATCCSAESVEPLYEPWAPTTTADCDASDIAGIGGWIVGPQRRPGRANIMHDLLGST